MGLSSGNNSVATPINTSNLGNLKIAQVDAGDSRSLVLAENGSVFSFGQNLSGATGLGTEVGDTLVATPIDTSNLGSLKVTQVAIGSSGPSLLLAENGSVYSFGSNVNGRTGLGTKTGNTLVATPINTSNLGSLKITQVDSGNQYGLLLAENGAVFSFGSNNTGRTGLGTDLGDTLVATPIATSNLGGLKITQVAAGEFHTLLLAENGSVFSFGYNEAGMTGLGTTTGITLVATPIDTSNLGNLKITQVAAGNDRSLLLAENGTVFSFGNNSTSGVGTTTGSIPVATPIDTSNLGGLKITQVAAGYNFSLLLAENGTVFSFGASTYPYLGRTGNSTVAAPIDTTNLVGMMVTDIAVGSFYSLLVAEPQSLPGDFNHNDVVDAADYVVWRKGLGDASGDYNTWRTNFGETLISGSSFIASEHSAVPEPATLTLLLFPTILAVASLWQRHV